MLVCRGAEDTQDLLDLRAPKENLDLMESWVPWAQRVCPGSLAWRGRRDLSACMATQDQPVTAGGRGAGETREKREPEAHPDSLEKLVPRPCQAPLGHEVLPAPREERESRVLGGFQGCREPPACGGWTVSPGSLVWLGKRGQPVHQGLLAPLGTRVGKVQEDPRGLQG